MSRKVVELRDELRRKNSAENDASSSRDEATRPMALSNSERAREQERCRFWQAVKSGNSAYVRACLVSGKFTVGHRTGCMNVVHYATHCLRFELVSLLIKDGFTNPDQPDSRGYPPLFYAIKSGSLPMVDLLIKYGATVSPPFKGGFSPLRESIRLHRRHESSITYALLKAGADINEQDRGGQNILFTVCSGGWYHPRFVNELIFRWGADPLMIDDRGNSILHKIVDISVLDRFFVGTLMQVIEFLVIRGGLDPNAFNSEGENPLHIVCKKCISSPVAVSVASSLIKVGADPNFPAASNGWSPLYYPVLNYNKNKMASQKLIDFLLESGADPSIQNTDHESGYTLIHSMVDSTTTNNALLEQLVRMSSNPHQFDDGGNTPLHLAFILGKPKKIVLSLVGGGMNPSCRDGYGDTILLDYLKCGLSSAETMKFMVECGCDVNAKDSHGYSALHLVSVADQPAQNLRTLIQLGANIDSTSEDGTTPLHTAAIFASSIQIRILKEAGASLYAGPVPYIPTPLSFACQRSRPMDVLRELIPLDFASHRDANGVCGFYKVLVLGIADSVRGVIELAGTKLLDSRFEHGMTPLHVAAQKNEEVCDVLITYGANANARGELGMVPLHFARNARIVDTLVKAGANVNAHAGDGFSPLSMAAVKSRTPVVSALLKHGACDEIALGNACSAVSSLDCFTVLLQAHSDFNVASRAFAIRKTGASHLTLVQLVCRAKRSPEDSNPRVPILKHLLEILSKTHGAHISHCDSSGSNALEDACCHRESSDDTIEADDLGVIYELLKFQASLTGSLQGAMYPTNATRVRGPPVT